MKPACRHVRAPVRTVAVVTAVGKRVGRPWGVQLRRAIGAAVDETARRAADPTCAGCIVLAAPFATTLHLERGCISPYPPGLSLGVAHTPKRTHSRGAHPTLNEAVACILNIAKFLGMCLVVWECALLREFVAEEKTSISLIQIVHVAVGGWCSGRAILLGFGDWGISEHPFMLRPRSALSHHLSSSRRCPPRPTHPPPVSLPHPLPLWRPLLPAPAAAESATPPSPLACRPPAAPRLWRPRR